MLKFHSEFALGGNDGIVGERLSGVAEGTISKDEYTAKMNKFVCDKLNIPIAQGERIYSRWGYAPYFEDGSIQLIQPDVGNCGGLTEAKKICDLAYIYDVGVQAHVCASPLSTAVALQLEAAIPNFTIHEHHVYNRYDYNKNYVI